MKETDMGPGMKTHRFDRLTLFGRRWFFRVVDLNNGLTLAQSEAYNSARARDKTADRFDLAFGFKRPPLQAVAPFPPSFMSSEDRP